MQTDRERGRQLEMYLNLPHLPHLEVLLTADYINFEMLEENTCLFFDFSLVFLHFHSEICGEYSI